MATALPVTIPIKDIKLAPGSSILMSGLSWAQFEQLLVDVGDSRHYRLSYYKGVIEVLMPSDEHEFITRMVDALVSILCEEMELNLKTMGSTTLKTQQESAPEADNEYYIQNEPLIRGKKIDLAQDPPPDLVVEIDITHSNLNKKEMYRQMEVPEFWSYSGKTQQLTFYVLQSDDYTEQSTSQTFPFVQKETLNVFIERCNQEGELAAKRWMRSWVQQQLG